MATQTQLTTILKGRTIDSVRQRGTDFDIDFADGSTLSLTLGNASGSVTLTGKDDKEEYAG